MAAELEKTVKTHKLQHTQATSPTGVLKVTHPETGHNTFFVTPETASVETAGAMIVASVQANSLKPKDFTILAISHPENHAEYKAALFAHTGTAISNISPADVNMFYDKNLGPVSETEILLPKNGMVLEHPIMTQLIIPIDLVQDRPSAQPYIDLIESSSKTGESNKPLQIILLTNPGEDHDVDKVHAAGEFLHTADTKGKILSIIATPTLEGEDLVSGTATPIELPNRVAGLKFPGRVIEYDSSTGGLVAVGPGDMLIDLKNTP